MLRLFKQYYPIRNALFVLGEGIIIFSSVIIACWILMDAQSVHMNPALFHEGTPNNHILSSMSLLQRPL